MWRKHRDLIEQDLHSEYQMDVDLSDAFHDPILAAHTWRWFLVRLNGLLSSQTRLFAALAPAQPTGAPRVPEHR